MSPCEVRLTQAAKKDLDRLKGLRATAVEALRQLEADPEKGHALSGSLSGVRSLEFSIQAVAYRAVYVHQAGQNRCLVFQVGAHEGFYEEARRRYVALRKSGQA